MRKLFLIISLACIALTGAKAQVITVSTVPGVVQTYTYAAGDFTASAGSWTTVGGTTKADFALVGKYLTFTLDLSGSTVTAGGTLNFKIPGGYTSAAGKTTQCLMRIVDNGGAATVGLAVINPSTQQIVFTLMGGTAFAISTANTNVQGVCTFAVL